MKPNISLPIKKIYSSENYSLMIVDSENVTHYWDFDGRYDGWSSEVKNDCSNEKNNDNAT